jgi:hypothetical protein
MIAPRAQSEQPLRRLWWLGPASLFAFVIGGTMLAAAVQSDAAFRLYGAPKFIAGKHLLLAAAAIAAFAIGRRLADATGKVPAGATRSADGVVRLWFWLAAVLTLFGYAVWLAVGVKNGFSLGTLRDFLTTDDPLLTESIRNDIFINLKGITTCTQFGVAAVPLGLWLFFRGERRVIWPVGLLIGLAAARALVFSERLALIELLVPALVVTLRMMVLGRSFRPAVRWGMRLAPLLGAFALLALFGGFEYFRSWRYYQNQFDSYAEFTLWRVTGYYTTAHNNSAMALETQPMYPLPYATLRQLWSTPGLASTPLGFTRLTGMDPTVRHEAMLERYGTPELNNEGGLFQPALDFGLAGLVAFWLGCGFIAGRLYRGYLVGTLLGVTCYPLVLLAILETPRFLYLCYPRSLPAVVTLLLVAWLAKRAHQPVAAPLVQAATA